MIKKTIQYIKDKEFRVNLFRNKVNIVNYKKIIIMEENKIVINHEEGSITVKGENLSISKLLDEEVLIIGKINSIELG